MASIFQVLLSFLDLAGVAIIGVLGSLTVNGVQSRKPGNRVESVLSFLQLDDRTFQFQAASLGVLAALLLMSRTLLSVFFFSSSSRIHNQRCTEFSITDLKSIFPAILFFIGSEGFPILTYESTKDVK
jgi:ATP-binding cassette subfamily C protein